MEWKKQIKLADEDFRKKLIVFYLYEQMHNNTNLRKLFELKSKADTMKERINRYVPKYFKIIKKDQNKESIINNRTYSQYLYDMKKNNNKIDKHIKPFVFNICEYFILFKIGGYTPIDCLKKILIMINNDNYFRKSIERRYLIEHYFSRICLYSDKFSPENKFKLIITCLNNSKQFKDPFFKFLVYLNLSLFVMNKQNSNNFMELIKLLSEDDLYLFLNYSFKELKLNQTTIYLQMIELKKKSLESVSPSPSLSVKFVYHLNAVYLFKIQQKRIIIINIELAPLLVLKSKISLVLKPSISSLVDLMSISMIKNKIDVNYLQNFLKFCDSKDNNRLAIFNEQIEKDGNKSILTQIQNEYLVPLRLLELVTHFFNNLTISPDDIKQSQFGWIEQLFFFIVRRSDATEWATLLRCNYFISLLHKIFQWYIQEKTLKNRKRDYLDLVIMHKIFEKIIRYILELPPLLFKDHRMHLLKKKGDAYYKMSQYDKAMVAYFKILKEKESDWNLELKIAVCCLKLYDYKRAQEYLNNALKEIKKTKMKEKKYKEIMMDIAMIQKYLNLNEV